MRKQLYILLLLFSHTVLAQQVVDEYIVMWTTGKHTLWDGEQMPFYGFSYGFANPVFPGPTLYAEEGDSVYLRVRNQSQGARHTVHLHGLDVDQENDGVPGLSFDIKHMETRTYKFKAPHAGTYLYHCHVASIIHVQMGMYGSFVIQPKGGGKEAWTGGPAYDQEYNWLLSEADKSWHDSVPHHSTGDSTHMLFAVPPYVPDYFFVNGESEQQIKNNSNTSITAAVGEKVYLRLSAVGFLMNEVIFPAGLNAEIIASDGRPLPAKDISDTILLTPGERYGVMLEAGAEFVDSIKVRYLDMNTGAEQAHQWVPVTIEDFIGVEESFVAADFQIYPNPSDGIVYFSGKIPEKASYELLDVTGRKMQSGLLPKNAMLNFKEYPKGIYFLRIVNDQQVFTKKIMIQ